MSEKIFDISDLQVPDCSNMYLKTLVLTGSA